MSRRRLTVWITGSVKPKHAGVYQRDYRNARGDRNAGITFSYWNGKRWGLYGETEDIAVRWACLSSSYQDLPWRGLAENPIATAPSTASQKTEPA